MVTDIQLEHLYQRVHLVRGAGNRARGQLCIMSLVAVLAGEDHSDRPSNVSTVIRDFAVVINDAMPDHLRKRLKPFAPRLIGTKDEYDNRRLKMLLAAVHDEILPHAVADHLCHLDEIVGQTRRRPWTSFGSSKAWLSRVMSSPLWPNDPRNLNDVSAATARLLTRCASMLGAGRSEWYWLKAIDLLDRLCNASEEQHPRRLETASFTAALNSLPQGDPSTQVKSWPGTALNRLRVKMPGLLA